MGYILYIWNSCCWLGTYIIYTSGCIFTHKQSRLYIGIYVYLCLVRFGVWYLTSPAYSLWNYCSLLLPICTNLMKVLAQGSICSSQIFIFVNQAFAEKLFEFGPKNSQKLATFNVRFIYQLTYQSAKALNSSYHCVTSVKFLGHVEVNLFFISHKKNI